MNGALLVDKPAGPTSHDVVARVRRVLKTRAVGHTGTLDPFATGLLIVLAGRCTRLARFVEQQAKTYFATAKLGVTTTTDDLLGEPTGGPAEVRTGGKPERAVVEAVLAGFLGPQKQRPPAFSAKRVDGERSYAKARRGELLDLAEVDVVVHAVELVGFEYPEVRFRITVSPGTYIRGIARDLGERLGTGAHLTALRREAIGSLQVDRAVRLDALTDAAALLPPLAVLSHLARVELTETDAKVIGFGQAVRIEAAPAVPLDQSVAAVAPGERLVAIGKLRESWFHPEVVLEAAG
ncbi:MAG: tRNA pseudouridine(55) synthase TruB [Gemmatimonadota bacterium]